MKVKDITRDWIRANFDIDKERKIKVIHSLYNDYSLVAFIENTNEKNGGVTLEGCIEQLKTAFDAFAKDFGVEVEDVRLYDELDWENRDIRLRAEKEIPESDEDVITRLQRREKERLKKKLIKQETEERERKQYEKLKKKFEKE
jgi:hypothetical protein